MKEDLVPDGADRWLFRLAPYLAFVPVFAAFAAVPFGPELTFEPRLTAGVFWLLAILSVEVIGVILAGWAATTSGACTGPSARPARWSATRSRWGCRSSSA